MEELLNISMSISIDCRNLVGAEDQNDMESSRAPTWGWSRDRDDDRRMVSSEWFHLFDAPFE